VRRDAAIAARDGDTADALAENNARERAEHEARRLKEQLAQQLAERRVQVVRHLRTLELVTSTIEARVASRRAHESWRGDVRATVVAPVRYRYGVDLSTLDVARVGIASLGGACVVTVPEPKRLGVEVMSNDEVTRVDIEGLRTRSRSGEFYLGLARKGLWAEAWSLPLSPEDAARVRDDARAQVAALVRAVLGENTVVIVRFDDEPQGAHAGAQAEAGTEAGTDAWEGTAAP
jgi:hypothetical protein